MREKILGLPQCNSMYTWDEVNKDLEKDENW